MGHLARVSTPRVHSDNKHSSSSTSGGTATALAEVQDSPRNYAPLTHTLADAFQHSVCKEHGRTMSNHPQPRRAQTYDHGPTGSSSSSYYADGGEGHSGGSTSRSRSMKDHGKSVRQLRNVTPRPKCPCAYRKESHGEHSLTRHDSESDVGRA